MKLSSGPEESAVCTEQALVSVRRVEWCSPRRPQTICCTSLGRCRQQPVSSLVLLPGVLLRFSYRVRPQPRVRPRLPVRQQQQYLSR